MWWQWVIVTCCLKSIPLLTRDRENLIVCSKWIKSSGWWIRYNKFGLKFTHKLFKLDSPYVLVEVSFDIWPRNISAKKASVTKNSVNAFLQRIYITVIFPVNNRRFHDGTGDQRITWQGILFKNSSCYKSTIVSSLNSYLTWVNEGILINKMPVENNYYMLQNKNIPQY